MRFRDRCEKRKDVKMAYVTLEEGNTIDVTTGLQDRFDPKSKKAALVTMGLFCLSRSL